MEEDDAALDDEADYDTGKRTINQAGARGGKVDVLPEDSIAPADRDGAEEGEDLADKMPAYPLDMVITITKPGNKAIEIRAVASDGTIEIQNVAFFPKDSLLDAQSPKEALEARSLYAGPPINELDPELQGMLETYLQERGIDVSLANFLPDYIEYKEQNEYVRWLESKWRFCHGEMTMLTQSKSQTWRILSRNKGPLACACKHRCSSRSSTSCIVLISQKVYTMVQEQLWASQ